MQEVLELLLSVYIIVSVVGLVVSCAVTAGTTDSFRHKEFWELLTRRIIIWVIWPVLLVLWLLYVVLTTNKKKFRQAVGVKTN